MHALLRIVSPQARSQYVPRLLHTTSMTSIDYRWRRQNRLPEHVRQEPEFYDRPDFSFLDGRPTPLGKPLKTRYEDEKRLAGDAIKLLSHIEYALQREKNKEIQAEENARMILSRKLKPKGPTYKPKYSKEQQK